jgi:hypothetical protein
MLATGRLSGRVESVHAAAINLRFGSWLATVARESVGGLPMGIQLAGEPHLDRLGATSGMLVQLDRAHLVVPDAALTAALEGATSWSPAMPLLPLMSPDARACRAAAALQLAAPVVPRIGLAPLLPALAGQPQAARDTLAARIGPSLAELLESLAANDPVRAAAHARTLVGLGPGATPSGDDLLVGLLAGLAAICHPLAEALASRIAGHAQGRTTALSEQFLADAGHLRFSERAQRTTVAILTGGPEELGDAIEATLAWGASSGADLLAGILIGIGADLPTFASTLRGLASPAWAAA